MKNKKWWNLINFVHASRGIFFLIKTERNPTIYLVVMSLIALAARHYHLDRIEWSLLLIAITLVWTAEALNTAIELLADEISEERRERLGRAKDVAAGGVLVAAIISAAIGIMVFLPHLS
jgi:diacylglycerol kinase (ATP)